MNDKRPNFFVQVPFAIIISLILSHTCCQYRQRKSSIQLQITSNCSKHSLLLHFFNEHLCLKKGEAINVASYATTMHHLREAIKEKDEVNCPSECSFFSTTHRLTRYIFVMLLFENVISKKSIANAVASPDLAPSVYYLFP